MAGISVDFMTIFYAFFIPFFIPFLILYHTLKQGLGAFPVVPDWYAVFAPLRTPSDWLSVPAAVLR
jgi:hypothetical protein